MNTDIALLILGWILGLLGSLTMGLVMFWLDGRRAIRIATRQQRQDDTRTARNWAEEGKKGSLRGFDLIGANLSGKDLAGADLEDANLEGAQMWGTDLRKANLRRANFRKARLVGVNFEDANLHSSDFTGAVVDKSYFAKTVLRRTKLHKAKRISDCHWTDAKVDETTELSIQIREEIKRQSADKDTYRETDDPIEH